MAQNVKATGHVNANYDRGELRSIWEDMKSAKTGSDTHTTTSGGDVYQTTVNNYNVTQEGSSSSDIGPELLSVMTAAADRMDSSISQLVGILGPAFKESNQYNGWSEHSAALRRGDRSVYDELQGQARAQESINNLITAALHKDDFKDWVGGQLKEIEGAARAGKLPFGGELAGRRDAINDWVAQATSAGSNISEMYSAMGEVVDSIPRLRRAVDRSLRQNTGMNYDEASEKYRQNEERKLLRAQQKAAEQEVKTGRSEQKSSTERVQTERPSAVERTRQKNEVQQEKQAATRQQRTNETTIKPEGSVKVESNKPVNIETPSAAPTSGGGRGGGADKLSGEAKKLYDKADEEMKLADEALQKGSIADARSHISRATTQIGMLNKELGETEKAARAATDAETKREEQDKQIAKAEDMLTDTRLAPSNNALQALLGAYDKVQRAATDADRSKAITEMTDAMKPVSQAFAKFERDATSADKRYEKLTGEDMFKGLTGDRRLRVEDAYKAFQGARTEATLENLKKEMKTAEDLIGLHKTSNQSETIRQRIGKADDQLTAVQKRAGGIATWTDKQKDVFADADRYLAKAKTEANKGNFDEAQTALTNFNLAVGRLTPSLKEAEKVANDAATAQKKQDDANAKAAANAEKEQIRTAARTEKAQTKAERNAYYGDVDQQAKDRLDDAAAIYKATGDAQDLKNYQKALTGVQWREKAAEMKDYNKQLEIMRNPTGELGVDKSTEWAVAQQAQMQDLLKMQDDFREALRKNDQVKADSILKQMGTKTDELQASLQATEKIQKSIEKAQSGDNYGRVDQTLKDNLTQAMDALMTAAPDQFVEKMNGVRAALSAVNQQMADIGVQDYWAKQEAALDSYQSKLQGMNQRNGGMSGWTQSQQQTYGNIQANMAAAQAAMNAGDVGAYEQAMGLARRDIGLLDSSLTNIGRLTGGTKTQVDGLTRSLMNMAAPMMMWRRFTGYLKKAAQNVSEIDSQMADLKKVTNNTNAEYDQFLKTSGQNAVSIGSSISDLIATTSTFAHMGYGLSESQALGVTATKFANVGGFSNTTDAADTMIAAIKGFSDLDIGDADLVGDKLTAVANNYAVTVSDISDGLQKSAAALNVAGNNIDQSTAMITAIAEVTRDAGAAGSALKVLSMRIRGAKAE